MERLIRTIFYEYDTDTFHQIQEFKRPIPSEFKYAKWGKHVIGDRSSVLVSEGFHTCSGFALRDKIKMTFGLFHAYSKQNLSQEDIEKLGAFADGETILIEGSETIPNPGILSHLKHRLGIKHVGTISAITRSPQIGAMLFNVAFRPKTDEILVARNSHKDLLVYSGFNTSTHL